jgi:predicted ester cyclase
MVVKRILYIPLAATLAVAASPSNPALPDQEARNKSIATRVFEEIFNQGRFQVAQEIYAPDFKNHGLHGAIDLKTDQDAVHAEKLAFPDLRMTVDKLVAEGDLVTALWTFRGTHTAGGYGDLPPTGTRVEMRGMTLWRIVDGKIHDEWTEFDELGAYSQIVAHTKWYLLGAVATLMILMRSLEWAVLRLFRKILRSSKRAEPARE